MKLAYEKAIKHMAKITNGQSNGISRPVYKGVRHYGNTLSATDGHRLLYIEIEDENYKDEIINVKNNEIIEGVYPNIERLFLEDEDIKIILDTEVIKGIKNALACIKSAKYKQVKLMDVNGWWTIKPHEDIKMMHDERLDISYTIGKRVDGEPKERVFNLNYLKQAIDFIKDTKSNAQLIMTDNSLAPVQFSDVGYHNDKDDCNFKYIICPIRIYK